MMRAFIALFLTAFVVASPLAAQLAVPGTQLQVPPIGGVLDDVTSRTQRTLDNADGIASRQAQNLLRTRERNLLRLLRNHPASIEVDARGAPARRGELLVQGMGDVHRLALVDAGFTVIAREEIEGLGFAVHRLALPEGLDLAAAQTLAQVLAPDAEISADNLHFQAGEGAGAVSGAALLPLAMQSQARIGVEVGVIDGAPGAAVRVRSERGFAKGAPLPSDHGSAVASLLFNAGADRIRVADVYGSDPAGGNSLAIAKALGWLTSSGSKVVTISLVGPRNSLVERAVAAARRKGVVIVAAVGNDGPAAPPAYPASYDGVIAVTGVDGKGRALIEAGRALDLDYAAPGADVYAHDRRGKRKKWRGTSFAAPLAATRVAAALQNGGNWRARLDGEARDLGPKGADAIYGRGLLCEGCGRKK